MSRRRKLCLVSSCNKLHYAKGFCKAHYERWRKTGDPQEDVPIGLRVPPGDDMVSSSTLVEIVGITYRQLDYWVCQGYATPTLKGNGSGTSRWWSLQELVKVADLKKRLDQCPLEHGGRK